MLLAFWASSVTKILDLHKTNLKISSQPLRKKVYLKICWISQTSSLKCLKTTMMISISMLSISWRKCSFSSILKLHKKYLTKQTTHQIKSTKINNRHLGIIREVALINSQNLLVRNVPKTLNRRGGVISLLMHRVWDRMNSHFSILLKRKCSTSFKLSWTKNKNNLNQISDR